MTDASPMPPETAAQPKAAPQAAQPATAQAKTPLALSPLILGGAGLLPQGAAVLAAMFGGPQYHYSALAIGYAYAALIFSFLGGLWWGLAAAASARAEAGSGETVPSWLWVAAVAPSLIALLTYMPWIYGDPWPGPSLIVLGIAIAASPLIDRRIAALGPQWCPRWWMRLRWTLSLGLGKATLLLGVIAHL
jgi:hypothetical protein